MDKRSTLQRAVTVCAAMTWPFLLAGCASQKVTETGYLSAGYADLRPETPTSGTLMRKPDTAVLARYDSVMVDPVELQIDTVAGIGTAGASLSAVDRTELQKVAEAATTKIREALSKEWTVVTRPGPRTLRIRTALTAVRKANPGINLVLTIVIVPLDNGGLSAEADILGANGKSVASLTWVDQGRLNPTGYFSPFGHAKAVTSGLAGKIAKLLKRPKASAVS
jgi:hypothetical protein